MITDQYLRIISDRRKFSYLYLNCLARDIALLQLLKTPAKNINNVNNFYNIQLFSIYIYISLLIFNKLTELLKQTYLPKLGFAGLQHGKKYERDRFR